MAGFLPPTQKISLANLQPLMALGSKPRNEYSLPLISINKFNTLINFKNIGLNASVHSIRLSHRLQNG